MFANKFTVLTSCFVSFCSFIIYPFTLLPLKTPGVMFKNDSPRIFSVKYLSVLLGLKVIKVNSRFQ